MSLDDIVSVIVSTQATAVSRRGFGLPLIAAYHTHNTDRVRTYTSLAAMVADSFTTSEPAYLAAAEFFSQSPRVPRVAVGRRAGAPIQVETVTPAAVNGFVYTLEINGHVVTATGDGSATATEIVTALKTAIAAISALTNVVDASGTTTLVLTAHTAGTLFTLLLTSANLTRINSTPDPATGLAADLAAIALENDTWYGLVIDSQGEAEVLIAAAYAEANGKLFAFTSADSDIPVTGTGDLFSDLKALGYARTIPLYSERPHEYGGAGWMGELFPKPPGSATWAYKTLAGVTVSALTDSQIGFIEAKAGNHYTVIGGASVTLPGKTSAGEFIDITTGSDWFRARLQERVFGVLVNRDKVPFTDKGVAMLENQLRAQVKEAQDPAIQFLAETPAPVITSPLVADVSAEDKAARTMPAITMSATLVGAVHSAAFTVTLAP